jgi:hypothetical protein
MADLTTQDIEQAAGGMDVHQKDIIKLQSLLMQFIHPQVRYDLLSGKFGVEISEDRLVDMDHIRRVIIPPWRGASVVNMELQLSDTLEQLQSLFNKKEEVFQLRPSSTMTYAHWSGLFDSLASSTYWQLVDYKAIRVELITIPSVADGNPGISTEPVEARSVTQEREFKVHQGFLGEESISFPQVRYKTKTVKCPREYSPICKPQPIEEICLSDSTAEEDSDTGDSDSSCGKSFARGVKKNRYHKEVVKPMPFQADGWQSLKSFLSVYERYFHAKFKGNSRDCTQELANFLPPDIKKYYDVLGGRRLRYPDMKAELISWYKFHNGKDTKYWRDQLRNTRMKTEESLKCYGLKLKDIGQKAFPNSDRECLRELRHHFLQTVPVEFSTYIMRSEEGAGRGGIRQKLTWSEIMRLAESEDRRQKKFCHADKQHQEQEVWFSTQESDKPLQPPSCMEPGKLFQPQTLPTSGPSGSVRPSSQQQVHKSIYRGSVTTENPERSARPLKCSWCGRNFHTIESCWEKQGACLLCGSMAHRRVDCPKFNPNFQMTDRASCPICKGSHLGRDCTSFSSINC